MRIFHGWIFLNTSAPVSTSSKSEAALKWIGLRMNQALARNGGTATANLVCGDWRKKGERFSVRLAWFEI
jgi:hypothetical protein